MPRSACAELDSAHPSPPRSCFNGALFTLRTRSLNNMLYWLTQILSAIAFGMALDSRRVRRTVRAWMGLLFVAVVTMCVWGGSRYFQRWVPIQCEAPGVGS